MKKAIAAILADTHLKEDNISINKSIFQQAIEIANSYGLKEIDHAGDIFNSRKAQTQVTLDAFDEIVSNMYNQGMTLNVVVGNHDKTDYGSEVSFVKQFRHHPSVNIFNTFGKRKVEDVFIHYLSFFSDDVYIDQLKSINISETDKRYKHVLLTHIGIAGSVMNNGTVIESESIVPSLFRDFDLTLVGHFHDAQILAEGKIRYIGASVQHNFGELTGKGLTILYNDLTTEIITLKYPQYIKYEISPNDITLKDIADLKEERELSGDNIRVILVGKEVDLKAFNKQALIDAGVSVQHKADNISREELQEAIEPFDILSLKAEFEEFCEKNNLDINQGMKYFNNIISA